MRILVMAAGAVGGYFGSLLARSGQEVTMVARGEHLLAIRQRGLKVESVSRGTFLVHPTATDRLDGSWKADLVLYCVKSYDNEQAIEVIKPAVGDATAVLTLQNGIGGGDALEAAFGAGRVLLGAAYVEATRTGPGVVAEHGGASRVVFGEPDGREAPGAREIRDVLAGAGIEVVLSPDMLAALWTKLVFISALSGMTCITRAPFARVLDTPETLDLTWRVMRETAAVAGASGVALAAGVVEKTMEGFQAAKHQLVSSMYGDLLAGRRLEVDVINGAVSRIGRETGVETPVNDIIRACLAVAEQSPDSG